jgi:hypothetical protein
VPPDFPFAHFAVYEGERPVAQFTMVAAPEEFAASPHEPAVNVAGTEFVRERDGSLALRLRGLPMNEASGGPGGAACLSAQLVFRPLLRHALCEMDLAGTRPGVDVHRWVIAAPACEVTGSIVFTPAGDASRAGVREIAFRGRGYHDHRYGTAPPSATLRRWASGRVFLGGTTYVFHAARPLDREATECVRLVRCDPEGIHEVERGPTRVAWNNGGPLPYPAELTGDGGLRLTTPRMIDSDRCRVRLLYHAEAPGGGEKGTAWCEVGVRPRNASLVRRWVAKGR